MNVEQKIISILLLAVIYLSLLMIVSTILNITLFMQNMDMGQRLYAYEKTNRIVVSPNPALSEYKLREALCNGKNRE